jgi:hypothetical protein
MTATCVSHDAAREIFSGNAILSASVARVMNA